MARFSYGIDDMFTGSTTNQRQIIAPDQPYPGDNPVPAASIDGSHTGSIDRDAVTPVDLSAKPVSRSALAPVAGTTSAPADSKPLVKVDDHRRPAPSSRRHVDGDERAARRARAIRPAGRAPAAPR